MHEVSRFVFRVETQYGFAFPHTHLISVRQNENDQYFVFTKKVFDDGNSEEDFTETQSSMSSDEYVGWLTNVLYNQSHRTCPVDHKAWLYFEDNEPRIVFPQPEEIQKEHETLFHISRK